MRQGAAEAELYAANKAIFEGLGLVLLARRWIVSLGLTLELDASATKGILERRALGKGAVR